MFKILLRFFWVLRKSCIFKVPLITAVFYSNFWRSWTFCIHYDRSSSMDHFINIFILLFLKTQQKNLDIIFYTNRKNVRKNYILLVSKKRANFFLLMFLFLYNFYISIMCFLIFKWNYNVTPRIKNKWEGKMCNYSFVLTIYQF